jgi:hypothetical protein
VAQAEQLERVGFNTTLYPQAGQVDWPP